MFRSPAASNRILIHSPIGNNRTLLINSPIMNDNSNRRIIKQPFISPKSSERRLSGDYICGTPVRKAAQSRLNINKSSCDLNRFEGGGEEGNEEKCKNDADNPYHSNMNTPIISPCSVVAQRAIGIIDCSKSNASLLTNRLSTTSTNSKGSKGSKGSKSSAKVVPIEFSEEIVQ